MGAREALRAQRRKTDREQRRIAELRIRADLSWARINERHAFHVAPDVTREIKRGEVLCLDPQSGTIRPVKP